MVSPPRLPLRYPGDIKNNASPKTALRGIQLCKSVINRQRKELKVLRAKNRRHIKKINNLKQLLSDLKNKFCLSDIATNSLEVRIISLIFQ